MQLGNYSLFQAGKWALLLSIVVTCVYARAVDSDDLAWKIDGIKYSDIPEEFRLAAYMLEVRSKLLACRHRSRDLPATCPNQECVDILKKYEDWREANGYGIASGRWG